MALAGPDIDLRHLEERQPVFLHGGYPNGLIKACSAKHFLDLLERHKNHQVLATYYFDAFLAAARSVSWVLKKECSELPGFPEWYQTWQSRLANDARARLFRDLRNEAQKEGAHLPRLSFAYDVKHALDGSVSMGQLHAKLSVGSVAGSEDAIAECRGYLAILTEMVEEGRANGFPPPPANGPEIDAGVNLLRETPSGEWVPFDLPDWRPKPEEFPSKREYDEWRRTVTRNTAAL